ncbi:ATP-binding cassette domain-containing protein, partial [Candidatus Aerophobetes bacterium]|nr:ATP-binding cassette domain-containing protein [Candidatus Aerophobetes bacterium]
MIRVENLTKKYRNIIAVNNLNLEIKKQEIFGLLGPNGAGKTTTIRILSTLTLPTSGNVYINGYDIVKNPVQAKKEIGVIHQTHNIDLELTGFENLIIHGLLFKMKISKIKRKAEELLELIDLKKDMHKFADKYSGGMRRRLTIARALLHNPNLLIMDEPTAGLDVYTR